MWRAGPPPPGSRLAPACQPPQGQASPTPVAAASLRSFLQSTGAQNVSTESQHSLQRSRERKGGRGGCHALAWGGATRSRLPHPSSSAASVPICSNSPELPTDAVSFLWSRAGQRRHGVKLGQSTQEAGALTGLMPRLSPQAAILSGFYNSMLEGAAILSHTGEGG